MTSAEDVDQYITVLKDLEFNVNAFHIAPGANGEENSIIVIFNPRAEATSVTLPEGTWEIHIDGEHSGTEILGFAEGAVEVDAISACVLVQAAAEEAPATEPTEPVTAEPMPTGFDPVPLILIAISAAGMVAAAVFFKKEH